MEKDNLEELFEIFKKDLKSNEFTQEFFISLSECIFYQIEESITFSFSHIPLIILSKKLSEFRNRELFENSDKFDLIRYYRVRKNRFELMTTKKDNFIVLENTKQNIEYIRSLSRDNKINHIIDEHR